ncbi:hypothetical protein [Guyparkeria sp. TX1]|uniref:hypothetical protein n=1 Tax=Guyparkeria sp. TX1 TaxID=3115001 RepID=UPI003977C047
MIEQGTQMTTGWEVARTIFSGLTLLSIAVAYLSYRASKKKQEADNRVKRDKEIADQASLSLRWAYDVLSDGADENSAPLANRLSWLTSARHLIRYRWLRASIKTETQAVILAEQEEYWRHRFYVLLDHPELKSKQYYMNERDPLWPEKIDPTSALVIADFSNWPKEATDPLDKINRADLVNNGSPFGGNIGKGVIEYTKELNKSRAQAKIGPAQAETSR